MSVEGESQVKQSKTERTNERAEDGPTCKSVDAAVMAVEQRGWVTSAELQANSLGG